ncbi:hypothetical protein ON062_12085 [Microbacterium sp. C7(2022)]|nr:hypothetical protein [Microbacterium sp. C7(2022)]
MSIPAIALYDAYIGAVGGARHNGPEPLGTPARGCGEMDEDHTPHDVAPRHPLDEGVRRDRQP